MNVRTQTEENSVMTNVSKTETIVVSNKDTITDYIKMNGKKARHTVTNLAVTMEMSLRFNGHKEDCVFLSDSEVFDQTTTYYKALQI